MGLLRFRGVTLAAQFEHGVDPGGGQRQHEDFAQGIQGAEVHQNHIDDIAPVTGGDALVDKVVGNAAVVAAAQHAEQQRGDHAAHGEAHQGIGQPGAGTGQAQETGQPEQHQHQHDHREGFHQHLGDAQIRGAEQHIEQGDGKAHRAQAGHRAQTGLQGYRRQGGADQHGGDHALVELDVGEIQVQLEGIRVQPQGGGHHGHQRQQGADQVIAQVTALQQPGLATGQGHQAIHQTVIGLLRAAAGQRFRPAGVVAEALPVAEQHQAHQHRADADQQGGVDAVPQGQRLRHCLTQAGAGGGAEQAAINQPGNQAQQQAQAGQQGRAQQHGRGRFAGGVGEGGGFAEPGADGNHRGHGHAQGGGDHDGGNEQRGQGMAVTQAGFQQLFLGDKAEQGHDPGQGQGGQAGAGTGHGQIAGPAAGIEEILAAGLVVNDAGHHEQSALVQGVGQQVAHGRQHGGAGAQADQQGQGAQGHDGGIGQHALDAGGAQGQEDAQHHGDGAGAAQQQKPQLGAAHGRVQPCQQVDARLHHGGRMQVGAHRGGRGHGVGEPEMERELGALGEGA